MYVAARAIICTSTYIMRRHAPMFVLINNTPQTHTSINISKSKTNWLASRPRWIDINYTINNIIQNNTFKAMTLTSLAIQSNYMGQLHHTIVEATMNE